MHVLGQVLEERLDVRRQEGARRQVGRHRLSLLGSRNLASEQQPKQTLGQRLLTALGGRQQLLALGDAVATEANALLRERERERERERRETRVEVEWSSGSRVVSATGATKQARESSEYA